MGAEGTRWALLAALILQGLLCGLIYGCTPEPGLVVIDLKTDYSPGVEFDRVEVALYRGAEVEASGPGIPAQAVDASVDGLSGFRVAELRDAPLGTWRVLIRLKLGSQEVGRSMVLADLSGGSQAITLIVTRNCANMECPGEESLSCVGGRCVDARCTEQTPEFCPPDACTDDAQCPPSEALPGCAVGLCLGGACASILDDTQCTYGVCRPAGGCALADDIVQLTAGGQHTCALRAAGEVLCWGRNQSNQLAFNGPGSATPQSVAGLVNVAEVRAGGAHTCARTIDGEVFCWGSNSNRQVSVGSGGVASFASPVQITGLDDAVGLSAGELHSCALRANGQTQCWGSTFFGQTGSDIPVEGNVPATVISPEGALDGSTSLEGAVEVTGSGLHGCARMASGQMFCWGNNVSGQLGDGTADEGNPSRPRPEAVLRPIGETLPREGEAACGPDNSLGAAYPNALCDVVRVAGGGRHTCALRASGELYCWGDNPGGELGIGSADEHQQPFLVSGAENVLSLDASYRLTCTVVADGGVLCWGSNEFGSVGSGVDGRMLSPVRVSGLSDAVEVATGNGHACARRANGEVYCWGDNAFGQVGAALGDQNLVPTAVPGLADVSAAVGGDSHSCALDAIGDVYCWGQNLSSQLGDGTRASRPEPIRVQGLSDVYSLSSSANFSCALLQGGQVQCWGGGESGQLGDMGTRSRGRPVSVVGLGDAVQVSCGERHACALRSNGEVVCWGNNARGQLGDGTTERRLVPTMVEGLDNMVEVRAGKDHTCARTLLGQVRCWGNNQTGQAGGGVGEDLLAPRAVGGIANATQLSASRDHTCALTSGGLIRCWGGNFYGNLGISEASDFIATEATDVPGLVAVLELGGGSHHTCARTASAVYCWGRGTHGQIGDGTRQNRGLAVAVPGLTGARALSIGWNHSCVVTDSGEPLCWGDNNAGQLGFAPTWTPNLVSGL